MGKTTTTQDAVSFLLTQHETVKGIFSDLKNASGEQRAETFQCLVRTLAVHETAEEEIVYPIIRRAKGGGDALVEARLAEESEAKQVLAGLEKDGVDDPSFSTRIAEFERAVLEHATAEEQQVFPILRAECSEDELRSMTAALEVAEKLAPTHPHPHGPDSALGNMIVGPFVAVADRVRDALRPHKR